MKILADFSQSHKMFLAKPLGRKGEFLAKPLIRENLRYLRENKS